MKKIALCFLIFACLISCKNEDSNRKAIDAIPIELQIHRFDREFATAKPSDIPFLKTKYPYLFPKQYPDSVWTNKIKDTLFQSLYKNVDSVFGDFEMQKKELADLYKHRKFYFSEVKTPQIVTVISEVDYTNKVILTDSLLLLSLDTYLGSKHPFYEGIPRYLSYNLKKENLSVDVAAENAQRLIKQKPDRTFLSQMIYWGKVYYLVDLFLPDKPDATKLGYRKEELEWAKENETYIWLYFIDREMLYSTDSTITERFINPAPFSKFYLEIDQDSPGRIGQYLGWRIVDSFMKNNPVSLQELLDLDAQTLFEKSKFKPLKP
ncbi:MAG: gliding motility lipoprotein GldB [Flavobacteriales bacterium CG_4_9_14_3_um_filter_40_17]|nr:MAG: gliding motility lipoprotein GldB [Flavobacteriales bacterium CG_4_9_14_3_um_filter_40_17]